MKSVQRKPGALYGESNPYRGEIDVNIEYIWKTTKNEDKFIKVFAQTYNHELIHMIIQMILGELIECEEERFIREMLSEEWDKGLSKSYSCKIFRKL